MSIPSSQFSEIFFFFFFFKDDEDRMGRQDGKIKSTLEWAWRL